MSRRRQLWIVAAALIVATGAGACLLWWWSFDEDLEAWRSGPPPHRWAVWMRQERLWRDEGLDRRPRHVYVPLEAISIDLQLAVLVSEDINFFGHGAVDTEAVGEALEEWWDGSRLRGASTISQQLARTLFLSADRSLWRKLKEFRLAWWMERRLGKKRILELYLNAVEFGPGLLGAEAASKHYHGVAAAVLPGEYAAGLAATLPSPGRDNPYTATELWDFRRETILRRMGGAPWLRERLEALNGVVPTENEPDEPQNTVPKPK
jgi:monofunctional biosynthetic peptidoglycan transglycosylase